MAEIKTLNLPATVEQLPVVQDFIEDQLNAAGCAQTSKNEVLIVVEEIFVNIALYAYQSSEGKVTIHCFRENKPPQIVIRFSDQGTPFNPLAQKCVDTTLPVEERGIGGLGILMIQKLMDEVTYRYEDGKNILTVKKLLPVC